MNLTRVKSQNTEFIIETEERISDIINCYKIDIHHQLRKPEFHHNFDTKSVFKKLLPL